LRDLLAAMVLTVAALLVFGAASAIAQQPDVTIAAEGPAVARPGDMVTYQFSYIVEGGPGTDIAAGWYGERVTYASQRVVSGGGRVVGEPAVGDTVGVIRWSVPEGSGVLEMTLRVPEDAVQGKMGAGAHEPGTETTASNAVTTLITPAALPDTGSGSLASGDQAIPVWLVVALLVVGGMAGLVAAARTAALTRSR
jgi:hypothetical protein